MLGLLKAWETFILLPSRKRFLSPAILPVLQLLLLTWTCCCGYHNCNLTCLKSLTHSVRQQKTCIAKHWRNTSAWPRRRSKVWYAQANDKPSLASRGRLHGCRDPHLHGAFPSSKLYEGVEGSLAGGQCTEHGLNLFLGLAVDFTPLSPTDFCKIYLVLAGFSS